MRSHHKKHVIVILPIFGNVFIWTLLCACENYTGCSSVPIMSTRQFAESMRTYNKYITLANCQLPKLNQLGKLINERQCLWWCNDTYICAYVCIVVYLRFLLAAWMRSILRNSGKPKFQGKCQMLVWEFVEVVWEINHLNIFWLNWIIKSLHKMIDLDVHMGMRAAVEKSCKCLFPDKSIPTIEINTAMLMFNPNGNSTHIEKIGH